MNENSKDVLNTLRIGSIDELLNAIELEPSVSVSKRVDKLPASRVPTTVRKLRAARLKRRMERSIVLGKTRRSGKTHWKAVKAKKRKEKQWPSYLREQRKNKQARLADPPRRYKDVLRTAWKPRLAGKINVGTGKSLLDEVMSQDQYVWLMNYVPEFLFELHPDVFVDTKKRNLEQYLDNDSYIVNSYVNHSNASIINTYHMIVRLDTTKSYTLDNVLVIDYYSKMVLYKPL